MFALSLLFLSIMLVYSTDGQFCLKETLSCRAMPLTQPLGCPGRSLPVVDGIRLLGKLDVGGWGTDNEKPRQKIERAAESHTRQHLVPSMERDVISAPTRVDAGGFPFLLEASICQIPCSPPKAGKSKYQHTYKPDAQDMWVLYIAAEPPSPRESP